jgi:hypothetical protein
MNALPRMTENPEVFFDREKSKIVAISDEPLSEKTRYNYQI